MGNNYEGDFILNPHRAFLYCRLSLLFALFLIYVPAPSLAGEVTASPLPPASALPLAVGLPFCLEDVPQLQASTEKGSPAPIAAVAFPIPRPQCGACSVVSCRGVTLYAQCQDGKPISPNHSCYDVGVCTADGSPQCACGTPQ